MVCDWDYIEILKKFCDVIDAQLKNENSPSDSSDNEDDQVASETTKLKKKEKGGKNQPKKLRSPLKMRNKQGLTPVELAYEENT